MSDISDHLNFENPLDLYGFRSHSFIIRWNSPTNILSTCKQVHLKLESVHKLIYRLYYRVPQEFYHT